MKHNAWMALLPLVTVGHVQAQPSPDSRPPALVVNIAVDQLRQDYLERFRAEFTGGFARLLRNGAVFTHASESARLFSLKCASEMFARFKYATCPRPIIITTIIAVIMSADIMAT